MGKKIKITREIEDDKHNKAVREKLKKKEKKKNT